MHDMTTKPGEVRRFMMPLTTTDVVLASDHDAAMRAKDAEIEELRRDMRLCRGHDIVAKFRMLSAERDDMLDKLIAAKAEIARLTRERDAAQAESFKYRRELHTHALDTNVAKLTEIDLIEARKDLFAAKARIALLEAALRRIEAKRIESGSTTEDEDSYQTWVQNVARAALGDKP